MKLYGFLFMGDQYDPAVHQTIFEAGNIRTWVRTARNFEEAQAIVRELQAKGCGALELCGAYTRDMALKFMEMTDNKMAIGYTVHEPCLDSAFDAFWSE